MRWRVLRVATISPWGFLLLVKENSWLMPQLTPVITILILLMIASCVINYLTHFVSAQVNKLQNAVLVQQGRIKLHLTMENVTHPQIDTTIRTLRVETSKRANAPRHSSSAGSRDLNTPILKELGLPSIKGVMLGSQNRKGVQNGSG